MYEPKDTPPLTFKGQIDLAVTEAIRSVCAERPTEYAREILEVLEQHPHSYPASALLSAVEHTLWLAESRQALRRGK
jgi:hypothetical protein